MDNLRKWILTLAGVVLIGSLFADTFLNFYIDWLWFESQRFESVFWTVVSAQVGLGFGVGLIFFLLTWWPLRNLYRRTSHLPILLSDEVQREIPILGLVASNLGPLFLFGPLLLAVVTGFVLSQQWEVVLKFLNAVPFGSVDPIFGRDYSFYLFTLPMVIVAKSLAWEIWVVVTIGVGLVYFFKRFMYVDLRGVVLVPEAQRMLSFLAGMFFILLGLEFFLERYTLLIGGSGVVSGIGFAQDYGRLPLLKVMIAASAGGAAVCFLNILRYGMKKVVVAGIILGVAYLAGNVYPKILQKFVVAPNELIKETPYIRNTVAGTLAGYGLSRVNTQELTGEDALNAAAIHRNNVTIKNIRLWDQEPLLDTLGQIQEIRTYYQFKSIDNDRYTIDGDYRQTLLSPRELTSSSLPNRTWINEHLTFTHGYGLSLSPVNEVTPEGLPVLFIKDIPPKSEADLKVTRPEIYFGELSNDYVFVNTGTKEFDYPEGEKNVYRNYEGKGGFPVGSFFRKILLAFHFKTAKIFFSQDINEDSRVLMYRNIADRVRKVAPFLRLDNDPYLVVSEGRMVWMWDAYTVSDKFPYSQTIPRFGNYVRNSVKIVIDAYDGFMDFYVADPEDPIIQSYRAIFPALFKNLSEMSGNLKTHIRYPSDLFAIQSFVYATYHMKEPQVFYNKEDQWEIPEIDSRAMQPYYTIMRLPGKEGEEYILMLPFTPRGKSNLSAWMVARSDGEHYGKLEVYTFPKQKLIYGPTQIVARINQEAEISRQISLWDQRGSRVIQGNLLVIPIEESLIYVRPLYLKADAGKIPELKRVIVGYKDQIAMEPTLDEALGKIFPGLAEQLPQERVAPAIAEGPQVSAPKTDSTGTLAVNPEELKKIRDNFQQILSAQKVLDTTLESYRKELEELGRSLDRIVP